MPFINFIRQIKRKISPHQPLIEVRIFRQHLLHNLNEFQKNYPQLKFAPVLKSNAYGHGIVETAKILDKEKTPFFCVDSFFEARQLRHEGIKTKILILGYVQPEEILSCHLKNTAFTITSLEQLQQISTNFYKFPLNIHLKIDTGMHRQGILLSEVAEAIKIIKENKNIVLEGICSHLADADNEDNHFTLTQIEEWNKTAKIFQKNFGGNSSLKFFHLSATAGIGYTEKINANVIRLGLGLYGLGSPLTKGRIKEGFLEEIDNKLNLKPILEMKTIITSIKEIKPGEKIGYGATFIAQQKIKIATVPTGYFEGLDCRLSNLGMVKACPVGTNGIKNKFCLILGRISMNISTIDVSNMENIKIGDEVIIISAEKNDPNSVENMAYLCQTIPYEILVHIPAHLKRIII